jgi:hypothetical protein
VLALFAGVGLSLHAQDAKKDRSKGRVLLLKNGHAMEGDIEKFGSQMCVRRGSSEVWIAAERTARLCENWDDAFTYVRSLVKLDDPNDVVKLARWCHLHRLTDQALDQARLALELQPKHSEAKQMVMMLERMKKDPARKLPEPKPLTVPSIPEPAPTVDVTSESSIAFTTRVQAVLMNTCASCHATNNGGKFKLDRVSDNSQKAATQRNLAAVMPYIDLDRPAISPLLTRAITPHGGAAMPAIRDRSSKPFQLLQQWIDLTVARNPHLKDYAAKNGTISPKREPEQLVITTGFASQGLPVNATDSNVIQATVPLAKAAPDSMPRTQSMTSDPYGAQPFNQRYHPNR